MQKTGTYNKFYYIVVTKKAVGVSVGVVVVVVVVVVVIVGPKRDVTFFGPVFHRPKKIS